MSEESKYPAHPAAACFPMMEGEAYERLREDIRANGLRVPIVLAKHDAQWMVLDGRNRQRACEETGRKVRHEYFDGDWDSAMRYAVSLNIARRHLNESQRGLVAAKLATLSRGSNQHARIQAPTQSEAAEMLNVGRSTVQSARAVLESNTPELVEAVESGELAVSRAAEIAKLERSQQLDALEQAKNTEAPRTRVERDGMMSIARLMKESEVMALRVLVEAGEWYAERDARARDGVKALLSVLPMVRK